MKKFLFLVLFITSSAFAQVQVYFEYTLTVDHIPSGGISIDIEGPCITYTGDYTFVDVNGPNTAFYRGTGICNTTPPFIFNTSFVRENATGAEDYSTVAINSIGNSATTNLQVNDGGGFHTLQAIFSVLDLIKLSAPVAQSTCGTIKIDATPNHPTEAYLWKYQGLRKDPITDQITTDPWQNLPIQQGQESITISLEDLYGVDASLYLNRPVNFQVYNQYGDYFDIVSYVFVDCSPQLVQDPPEVIPPKCSDSNDGSIIVKFGRPLASNERMLLYVENLLPNNTWNISGQSYILDATDINTATNNTYIWQPILAPNTYRLRYISKYDSTGNIPLNPNSDEMSLPFDVIAPLPIIFTQNKTDILCKGAANGSITFDTASGGSGTGYQYSIDDGLTWQNANTFTGLASNIAPATYNLRVKDSKNCISEMTASVTITEPNLALSVDFDTFNNPSAAGVSDGTISILVSGGTGTVTYQWTKNGANFSTNQNLTDLGAGVYKVTVTDANGCTATTNELTLEEPPALSVILSAETIDCNGDTATITAQGQGGFIANGDSYTYLWNNGATTKSITVVAGDYAVTVTDSNGATATAAYTLTQPTKITVVEKSTDVLCSGANNGTIELEISGGTGNYTIAWQDDATIISANRTNLANGDYFYTITDEKGCFTNGSIFISEPLAIEIVEGTIINPTTVGGTNGSIEVNVSKGTPPYTYQWTNSNGDPIGTNSNTISGLGDDTYTVTVHDANYTLSTVNLGCESSLEIRLAEPQPLSTTINEIPISCFGENDGQLTANPVGGSGIYTYEWFKENNGNFETLNTTTKIIANLGIDKYRVIVTDDTNAQAQADYTLNQPEELKLTSIVQHVFCYGGSDGTIEVAIGNGTPPYTYGWTNTSGVGIGNDKLISGLSAGNYTVSIIDAHNCFLQKIIQVTEPEEPLTIEGIVKDPSSATANDGSIKITVSGGTPDYTYQWTDENGTPIVDTKDLLNVGEGIYTLTVRDGNINNTTDNNGCILSEDFPILAPDAINIKIIESTAILCNGIKTGELTATVSGGFLNFGSDYTYQWYIDNNGTFESINQTTPVATNLQAGTYQLVVTDDHNVQQTANYQLAEPAQINITLTITNTVSCSGQDGSIGSLIEGGTPPYTYLWSNGVSSPTISNLGVGIYTLSITDNNGCEFSKDIELTQPDGMKINSTEIAPSCFGNNDGSILVDVSNGTSPYTFLWNTGATTTTISNLIAGNYEVSITDNTGCKSIVSFILKNPEQLTIDLGEDKELCKGQSYEIDATVEDAGAIYQWTSTNGFTSTSPLVSLSDAGEYTLKVTNSNGCITSDTIFLTTIDEVISADFLVPTQAFVGETIVVVDVSNPVPDTVTWLFSDGTTIVSQNGDYAELKYEEVGVYLVTMTTTKGSCQETLTKEIIVQAPTDFGSNQDESTSFIKEFKLFPNPSGGVFKAKIELQQAASVSIRIINLISNTIVDKKIGTNQENYIFDYSMHTAIGVYLVMLETPKGSQIRKIIIK